LNDASGVLVGVERVHEDERNVDVVSRVEVLTTRRVSGMSDRGNEGEEERKLYLDLTNREIQESHTLSNFNDTLGSDTSHRRTETSVEFEHGEFVEERRIRTLRQIRVSLDLIVVGSFNLVPVAVIENDYVQ
jgi:hypothetical protein